MIFFQKGTVATGLSEICSDLIRPYLSHKLPIKSTSLQITHLSTNVTDAFISMTFGAVSQHTIYCLFYAFLCVKRLKGLQSTKNISSPHSRKVGNYTRSAPYQL